MSRRAAEARIAQGAVRVNGKIAKLGESADAQCDVISIDGKPLPPQEKTVWVMLNKPRGYVTTLSDERGRKTAASLVDCGCRVFPVGRLDLLSEGLLLMTNDGEMANCLMHPRHEIQKTYEVTVRGETDGAAARLSVPIELDGRPIAPPKVSFLRSGEGKATFSVTIHEGRNRQIRRMCEAAGLTVLRLRRVREGALELGNLRVGAWRYLTDEELAALAREVRDDE